MVIILQKKLVIKILDYLDSHLYVKISINELSNTFHYNKDYIMRIFKKELNITIIDYINYRKIYNSLESIKYNDYSILKIATINGFSSLEYYSETFKKIIGVSPTIYRKFINYDKSISIKECTTISNNLVNIKYTLDTINKYKTIINKKTSLKLSLFK